MGWRDDVDIDFEFTDDGSLVSGGKNLTIRGVLTPYGQQRLIEYTQALRNAEAYLEHELAIWAEKLEVYADDEAQVKTYTLFQAAALSDLEATRKMMSIVLYYLLEKGD